MDGDLMKEVWLAQGIRVGDFKGISGERDVALDRGPCASLESVGFLEGCGPWV